MLFGRVLRVTGVTDDRWRRALIDLRAVVVRRGIRGADVDDVVQTAVEKALRRLDALRDDGSFEPWLRTIAANAAQDTLRAAARRPGHAELTAADAVAAETERPEPVLSFADCVEPFLKRLPAADRDVLRLKELDRRSVSQTADALGISVSAAKSRVRRARRRLAQDLVTCCAVLGDPSGQRDSSIEDGCCPASAPLPPRAR